MRRGGPHLAGSEAVAGLADRQPGQQRQQGGEADATAGAGWLARRRRLFRLLPGQPRAGPVGHPAIHPRHARRRRHHDLPRGRGEGRYAPVRPPAFECM